jgi:hypothetical protein
MLRGMETTPPITTAFEPCEAFVTDDDTPVCAACGWLEHEHDHAPIAHDAPRRLAA